MSQAKSPIKQLIEELRKKYRLKTTDKEIESFIAIQFRRMEQELKAKDGFTIENALEDKKIKKKKTSKK